MTHSEYPVRRDGIDWEEVKVRLTGQTRIFEPGSATPLPS